MMNLKKLKLVTLFVGYFLITMPTLFLISYFLEGVTVGRLIILLPVFFWMAYINFLFSGSYAKIRIVNILILIHILMYLLMLWVSSWQANRGGYEFDLFSAGEIYSLVVTFLTPIFCFFLIRMKVNDTGQP